VAEVAADFREEVVVAAVVSQEVVVVSQEEADAVSPVGEAVVAFQEAAPQAVARSEAAVRQVK